MILSKKGLEEVKKIIRKIERGYPTDEEEFELLKHWHNGLVDRYKNLNSLTKKAHEQVLYAKQILKSQDIGDLKFNKEKRIK